MTDFKNNIDPEKIDTSIELIKKYIKDDKVQPVIVALEALKQDPSNEALLIQLTDTLNSIGIMLGAVLTYAPYVGLLISDDPFDLK
ncbi:MAG: hypothetical protein COA54_12240 [Thiotrichaceae bacterium]|nr:MAG: hypothetical protein COA54_12240 [Thiotrichaceae bacterium]